MEENSNRRLFSRDGEKTKKFTILGLGVRSPYTTKQLEDLKVGEKYDKYTRVK